MDERSLNELADRLRDAGSDAAREEALAEARGEPGTGRDAVARAMLAARTPEEVEAAEGMAISWMRNHPEDAYYLAEAGESLEIVRRAQKDSHGEPRDPSDGTSDGDV